jgi:hypothetical protein
MASGLEILIELNTSEFLADLDKVEEKFTNLTPLLKQLGLTGVEQYKTIFMPDPHFIYEGFEEHNSEYSGQGRAFLSGDLKASVAVIDTTNSSVSVGPTMSYADSVNRGEAVAPIKNLKPMTPGFSNFGFSVTAPVWEEEILDYFSKVF